MCDDNNAECHEYKSLFFVISEKAYTRMSLNPIKK